MEISGPIRLFFYSLKTSPSTRYKVQSTATSSSKINGAGRMVNEIVGYVISKGDFLIQRYHEE